MNNVLNVLQAKLPILLTHTPAGTSVKTLMHFSQGVESKEFRHYDYGPEANMKHYQSETPPKYDLSKIQVPIAVMWGQNDYLSREKVRLYQ